MNMRQIDFFQPKTKTYWCNGTGRDTYIYINNGGLTELFSKPLLDHRSLSLQRPSKTEIIPKQVHYHSNGTGRDQYIMTDEGGFSQKYAPQKHMFASTLRSYERLPRLPDSTRDYFRDSQQKLPLLEKVKQRKIFQQQQFFTEKISMPRMNYQQLMQKSIDLEKQMIMPQSTKCRSKNELHQLISNKMANYQKPLKTEPDQAL